MFKKKTTKIDPVDYLTSFPVWNKTPEQRAAMTTSCRDTDYIPKVKEAGRIVTYKGRSCQVMHNGLKVVNGGYYGEWMAGIIKDLKGHHEPQEEKLFYEVVKRLGKKPTIMELGSFWAYYSNWLAFERKDAKIICCEPDPENIKIGITNAELNGNEDRAQFIECAAGSVDHSSVSFNLDSSPGKTKEVQIRSVDGLVKELKINKIDILHMDVQGAELDTIYGAKETIAKGDIRFIFVSTHHYLFSRDPETHLKCREVIESFGGRIIASHNVLESFSGDGLIVASFDERDKDFSVNISINSTEDSLFRPYEKDLGLLVRHIRGRAE